MLDGLRGSIIVLVVGGLVDLGHVATFHFSNIILTEILFQLFKFRRKSQKEHTHRTII